jgi:hypothetical protein
LNREIDVVDDQPSIYFSMDPPVLFVNSHPNTVPFGSMLRMQLWSRRSCGVLGTGCCAKYFGDATTTKRASFITRIIAIMSRSTCSPKRIPASKRALEPSSPAPAYATSRVGQYTSTACLSSAGVSECGSSVSNSALQSGQRHKISRPPSWVGSHQVRAARGLEHLMQEVSLRGRMARLPDISHDTSNHTAAH